MNRSDKNFRLSKSAKRVLATFTNPEIRNGYKRLMIDAEVEMAKVPVSRDKGSKGSNPTE